MADVYRAFEPVGVATCAMPYLPALMNPGIAGIIPGQGLLADVFHHTVRQVFDIQSELAAVGGKNQHAVAGQQAQGLSNQINLVTLYVEGGFHPF